MQSATEFFGPTTRHWFQEAFAQDTPVQREGWPLLAEGRHALLVAPTGSGKTLAAFLQSIDRLVRNPSTAPGTRVLYISPLKALVADIERNLRAPLVGIARSAELLGQPCTLPQVSVRTGDTSAQERRRQLKTPGEILVTTPESLYLILGSQARAHLRSVETVIVDEIHALAGGKRGAHLALSLERLARLCDREPQRIGLSATAHPLATLARFLGGDRSVSVVDTSAPPSLDLRVVVPVADMTRPPLLAPEESSKPVEPAEPANPIGTPEPAGQEYPATRDIDLAAAGLADPDVSSASLMLGPQPSTEGGLWPHLVRCVGARIAAHRTTVIFVNSRGLCERLVRRLEERLGEGEVMAHHGSLSHARRAAVEEALKAGHIRAIVATSSLELGIDMGAIDLVLMVDPPATVASGLQRAGRAGHQVGAASTARILPKHRHSLLEATVVAKRMLGAELEAIAMPELPLDILAQQAVAMAAVEPLSLDDLETTVRRAAPFRTLSRDVLVGVIEMLAGRYRSGAFAELRPLLAWDPSSDRIEARRGAGTVALVHGGTIPDRGTFAVHLAAVSLPPVPGNNPAPQDEGRQAQAAQSTVASSAAPMAAPSPGAAPPAAGSGRSSAGQDDTSQGHRSYGPKLGELDEEMVHETQPGQTFTLGASTWRVSQVTRDRVLVTPAPGEPGKLPFWRGDGPGRPIELGAALGGFLRTAARLGRKRWDAWLADNAPLDALARRNLIALLDEQIEATERLPSDRCLVVERFRDELGDQRICILSPWGSRVHAPWAMALQARLSEAAGFEVQLMWTDDGISLRLVDADALSDWTALCPRPDEVQELVVQQLGHSSLFAARFRENAARALLLPGRSPKARMPLWQQRLRAQQLLAVAREYPSFPIVVETYRQCLKDLFAMDSLVELLSKLHEGSIRVHEVETPAPSPWARALVFAYAAAYLYEGDAPAAERRVHALTLDRALLRELLGEDWSEVLDPEVIAALEHELQRLDPKRQVRHADALEDMLRELGALSDKEARVRAAADPSDWIAGLQAQRRVVSLRLGGQERWAHVDDVALYRDGAGAVPPRGVAARLLEPCPEAPRLLAERYARSHGPFTCTELCAREGLSPARARKTLEDLCAEGALLRGRFVSHKDTEQFCSAAIVDRIKRRSLAKLRREVEPVDPLALAAFLPAWQGVIDSEADYAVAEDTVAGGNDSSSGGRSLEEAIAQLEGLPLSFKELEQHILPARVPRFHPRMLDELGAYGWLAWTGAGRLGPRDGRVIFYRRERITTLVVGAHPIDPDTLPATEAALYRCLRARGACFFAELKGLVATPEACAEALWSLVWQGLVTNDTLAPLRALGQSKRRRGADARLAGRWSLWPPATPPHDDPALTTQPSPSQHQRQPGCGALPTLDPRATAQLHARAHLLLERYGVVCRASLAQEELSGGFTALYPVFAALEEGGQVRRGHFVEGLGGAQFASAGAVDRLRATQKRLRETGNSCRSLQVLAATDPANAYGTLLPWPAMQSNFAPRRAAGAQVVLRAGQLLCIVEHRGERLLRREALDDRDFVQALRALARDRRRRRDRRRILSIDGVNARQEPLLELFKQAGFCADSKGFWVDPSTP